jgi:2-C-methyl-D-erythritol 4-phosphate cytidylyltransferase
MNKSNSSQLIALVPAAGIGSRMQSGCPKQYLQINDKTIVEHSIYALLAHPSIQRVIVALHPNDTDFSRLAIASDPRIVTVVGGETRADSVLAGLKQIDTRQYGWVLVHDAARPCLHIDDLHKLIAAVLDASVGGILATPASDTMKQAVIGENKISHTIDRTYLWRALTPQMFPVELLIACLERALNESATITDEASALEYCGFHSLLVAGRTDNIKVTHPEDLALATFYLSH